MSKIIGIKKKKKGDIEIIGRNIEKMKEMEKMEIDMSMGVIFKNGEMF